MSAIVTKKSHVKFDDDLDEMKALPVTTKQNSNNNNKRFDSDSESDSEDEAPEEEGMDTVKEELEKKQMAKEALLKEEQRLLKEKRRKQDSIFKEQQAGKKSKKLLDVSIPEKEEQLEELPQELLQNIDTQMELHSKHINFDSDEMKEDPTLSQEIAKQLSTKSKKRTLRDLRKTIAKKGPVTVEVLSSAQGSRILAPKREIKVMSTKDRWLKRRSLKRK